MTPILSALSVRGRRGQSSRNSSQEPNISSNSSSRRPSSSSNSCKSINANSLDDWSDGFTGIVDLDRRMRELAMSEQGHSPDLQVYEPYSPIPAEYRKRSSSDATRSSSPGNSHSSSSLFSSFTNLHSTTSTVSSAATSRFSQDSRPLSKRRSPAAESSEGPHSPLRLAPLPATSSAFGNYRLTDASALSRSVSSPSYSSFDEGDDPLTPLAMPITPGTAAAATWTDPTAPSYFPPGLTKKPRSLVKRKGITRAPLPRLVSGEVVSSPISDDLASSNSLAGLAEESQKVAEGPSIEGPHGLRRSAQSLALGLRFTITRAKRKVTRITTPDPFIGIGGSGKNSIEGRNSVCSFH